MGLAIGSPFMSRAHGVARDEEASTAIGGSDVSAFHVGLFVVALARGEVS